MNIKTFYFNPYREATYVVTRGEQKQCLIIDAGPYGEKEQQRLAEYISAEGLQPVGLLITHTHPDHICGLDFIERTYSVKAIIFPIEGPLAVPEWSSRIEVLRTPGHKEDCVCYYFPDENTLFTGDTLFEESIGRTDLPGGDMGTLRRSLAQLMTLPDSTRVYPGHGFPTTIAHERQYNPFL